VVTVLYTPPAVTFKNSAFYPQSVSVCFVCSSEQMKIMYLCSINPMVYVMKTQCFLWGRTSNF